MKLKSNINIGEFIEIIGQNGKPREIISAILKTKENGTLIGLIYIGRRIINEENIELLSGKRHRKYYGIKVNNKIYINFGWHKIKKLTDQELLEVKRKWNFNFFEKEGAYLIEKSGGSLTPDHLIYTKGKIKI